MTWMECALWFGAAFCTGCGAPAAVVKPPAAARVDQNAHILAEILSLAQDGDWLVVRGYHTGDKIVMAATRTPISHAAVVDVSNQQVIESEAKGVHLTSLPTFVDKCHRIILIRPIWAERHPGAGTEALALARQYVGQKYDYFGTIGLNHPDKFYCSELALQIYRDYFSDKDDIPRVIEPGQMYLWGRILYDSRPRDEL